MSPANLQDLPLDIIHLVLLQMSQRDIGSLRLASKALSTIGIQYMLHTFPMRLTFDSITRVLALTENLALARHVHTLAFSTTCEDQLTPALSRVIDGFTTKHTAIVEELGTKYVSTESDILHRNLLKERKASERTWPECQVRYASSDLGPVLGERRLGFKPWFLNCADPALVINALHAFIVRFPGLRRIYMEQFGWIYDWKLAGQLSVYVWEPSLDTVLPGRQQATAFAEDESSSRDARLAIMSSKRWSRAIATWLRFFTRRSSTRRRGSRGLFDHLTFFILSDRSYTPFWPVAPKFEHLELILPSFMALASFNVPENTDDNGISFRMCLGAARVNVRSLSIKWTHVATELGQLQTPFATSVEEAGHWAWYVLRGILSWDMSNLEEVKFRFPYGYHTEDDAFYSQDRFLVPLTGTFGPPNIRKLDLSHFATTEEELNRTLGGARRTLRNLKLTRVDMNSGSWVGWFGNVRNLLDQLESAAFCDTFCNCNHSVQMEAVVAYDQYLESAADADSKMEHTIVGRTIGSILGEICLSVTSPDSSLRTVALRLLKKEMRRSYRISY